MLGSAVLLDALLVRLLLVPVLLRLTGKRRLGQPALAPAGAAEGHLRPLTGGECPHICFRCDPHGQSPSTHDRHSEE